MTEQELKSKIGEKFLSILHKLSKLLMDKLTENDCFQFRYLVSGCMEAMERANVSFDMNEQQRTSYNTLFAKIGSKCRISQTNNNRCAYNPYTTNMEYLSRIYNVFEKIDNFLSVIEKTKQFVTIINDTALLFNGISVNQNYNDEV